MHKKLQAFISGVSNGIFGAGGGIFAVGFFKAEGLSQKKAQATTLCVTLFLSAFSMIYYIYKDYFSITDALKYVPFGIPGAVAGSFLLENIPDSLLKKIFAAFIIFTGVRMIIK